MLDVGQQPGSGVSQVPQQLQSQQYGPEAALGQYGQVPRCQAVQMLQPMWQKSCSRLRMVGHGGCKRPQGCR